jgi:hypothetical protein
VKKKEEVAKIGVISDNIGADIPDNQTHVTFARPAQPMNNVPRGECPRP